VGDDQPKKRRFPRIATEHVALVRSTGGDEVEGFAKTRSLGLGGCGFVTDEAFELDSVVQLLVSLGGRAIAMKARVVYSLPSESRWETGVEFLEIDPADLAFLKSRLPVPPDRSELA